MNLVVEEIQDTLFVVVHSPVNDWVLDSWTSFHSTSHRGIIQNYVVCDFGKMYTANREAILDGGESEQCAHRTSKQEHVDFSISQTHSRSKENHDLYGTA